MSTAGKREWSVANVGNEIHTAAKEKISPEELSVTTRLTKGKKKKPKKHSYLLCETFTHILRCLFLSYTFYLSIYKKLDYMMKYRVT